MRLAEPGSLLLLTLIPVPWLWERPRPRIAWPTLEGFGSTSSRTASLLGRLPVILRSLTLACLSIALARPQEVAGRSRVAGQGVAIVVALDQSSSMNANDAPAGRPGASRLESAKAAFRRFAAGRPDDLIGLVVFANYPDLACPPTLDHAFLEETAHSIRAARPGDDGTNLGDAIAWSLEALRAAPPKRKVLILLTDGHNDPAVPNPVAPESAARLAAELGVTLHTIAIGGPARGSGERPAGSDAKPGIPVDAPDQALLERLAQLGGGRHFQAPDPDSLSRVFEAIDLLEKSPVRGSIRVRYRERYAPFVGAGLAFLVLDRLLSAGRARRLP